MLSVITNPIMLNGVMLSVVAPDKHSSLFWRLHHRRRGKVLWHCEQHGHTRDLRLEGTGAPQRRQALGRRSRRSGANLIKLFTAASYDFS
jgi:hypothetical protein